MGTLASPFQISVSIRPETHAMLATSGGPQMPVRLCRARWDDGDPAGEMP
jgi:hypothetical protein